MRGHLRSKVVVDLSGICASLLGRPSHVHVDLKSEIHSASEAESATSTRGKFMSVTLTRRAFSSLAPRLFSSSFAHCIACGLHERCVEGTRGLQEASL